MTAALITRIREVLTDGRGVLRVPDQNLYAGQYHEAMGPYLESVQGLLGPRLSIFVQPPTRNETSPPILCGFELEDVQVRIRCVRTFDGVADIGDEARDQLQGLAALDGRIIRHALTFPGNLARTEAGEETELISGALRAGTASFTTFDFVDGINGRVVTEHTFTGITCVTLPTS